MIGAEVTLTSGTTECEAALALVYDCAASPGSTLGADKAYDVWCFKQALNEQGLNT